MGNMTDGVDFSGDEYLDILPYPMIELYTPNDIVLLGASVGNSDNKKAIYNTLKRVPRARLLVPPPKADKLNDIFNRLLLDMPNFAEVLEHLRSQSVLRNRSAEPIMGSHPILLIGNPGIGKTHFASCVAKALDLEYYEIDMACLTASFELTGGSSQWSESRPGRIYDYLINGRTINPMLLLDECDKNTTLTGQYPPSSALFRMLNATQSRRFVDEAVSPLAINASKIIYILTANDTAGMHEAVIDRCLTFNIEQPTEIQAINVAKSVWRSIRELETWALTFDEQLSNEVLKALSTFTPRAMKKELEDAMARCALRGGNTLLIDDITALQTKNRKIGFC